jgi:hypothetical protein
MEQLILKVIKFDLGCITIDSFMPRFLLAAKADGPTCFLASVCAPPSLCALP